MKAIAHQSSINTLLGFLTNRDPADLRLGEGFTPEIYLKEKKGYFPFFLPSNVITLWILHLQGINTQDTIEIDPAYLMVTDWKSKRDKDSFGPKLIPLNRNTL